MWDSGWGNQKRKAQGFHGVFRYEMNSNDFEVPLETGLRRKLEEPIVRGAQVRTTGKEHLTRYELRSKECKASQVHYRWNWYAWYSEGSSKVFYSWKQDEKYTRSSPSKETASPIKHL